MTSISKTSILYPNRNFSTIMCINHIPSSGKTIKIYSHANAAFKLLIYKKSKLQYLIIVEIQIARDNTFDLK